MDGLTIVEMIQHFAVLFGGLATIGFIVAVNRLMTYIQAGDEPHEAYNKVIDELTDLGKDDE